MEETEPRLINHTQLPKDMRAIQKVVEKEKTKKLPEQVGDDEDENSEKRNNVEAAEDQMCSQMCREGKQQSKG